MTNRKTINLPPIPTSLDGAYVYQPHGWTNGGKKCHYYSFVEGCEYDWLNHGTDIPDGSCDHYLEFVPNQSFGDLSEEDIEEHAVQSASEDKAFLGVKPKTVRDWINTLPAEHRDQIIIDIENKSFLKKLDDECNSMDDAINDGPHWEYADRESYYELLYDWSLGEGDFPEFVPSPNNKTTNTLTYKEFETNVIKWAGEKGILENATLLDQISKTQEELTETRDAIVRLDEQLKYGSGNQARIDELRKLIKDGLGDQLVTLVISAYLADHTLEECGEFAWNEIKDRTGKMVGGFFVKD